MSEIDETRMVYKSTLKAEFGMTDRLIRMLGEPDTFVKNPHYRSGPPASLYAVRRVRAFIREHGREMRALKRRRNPAVQERRAKARARARDRRLINKYPQWQDALPDAAEAMFNLNRYAKHRSCTQENREDIYDMKNRLVRLLYTLGLCESAHLHQVPMPGKPCYGCNGTGTATRKFERLDFEEEDFDDSDLACYRCGGSGWYQQPTTFEYVCFKFSIGGKPYCWHQPKGSVDFEYQLVEAPNDWVPDQGAKELTMRRARLSKAKEVVRYVLAEGETEVPSSILA